ncbi:MAG: UvrD-helicase domain-containing protein [Ignavibacteriaceae bacterium]|nr:UvrD-helicase domain-containing protein [Ignavibacteriaceae bacterium]
MAEQLTTSQKAALNTEIHISLAANAGSGKTHVLKKRYAELLTKKDVFPQNIAAITFTEKAAAELYTKIRQEIEAYISNKELPQEIRNGLKKKKRLLSSARISTIHSFCSEILREFAIDAGVDPGFIPVDSVLSDEILNKAAEKALQKSYDDPDLHELQLSLQLTLGGYTNLRNALVNSVKKRGKLIPFFRAFSELNEAQYLHKADKYLKKMTAEISRNDVAGISSDKTDLSDTVAAAVYESAAKLADAVNSAAAPATPFDLPTVRSRHLELYHFNKIFSRLFDLVIEYYETGKREMNFLDHDDLILKARDIVMNNESEVSSHLNNKYRYIMIDEYQDTDDAQFDIFVSKLRELTTPVPNLFIVGDEKQSIYMFRNAEPQIFRQTREMIGEKNPGGVITLAESFRMSRELCAFNNALFTQVFADQTKAFNSVAPEELIYARVEEKVIPPPHIELLLSVQEPEIKLNVTQKKALQASLIAKRILNLIQDKSVSKWEEIGILLYENSDALYLQKAFAQYRIPHIFSGRTTQFQDQVTSDIINLFRFTADFKNDTALTGLLRSPFFMLSDKEIYQISSEDGFSLWDRFEKIEHLSDKLLHTRNFLNSFIRTAKELNPSELLRNILSETRYIEISSAINPPDALFAQIRSLADRIRVFEEEQNYTLYELILYLEELREKKGKEDPVFSLKGAGAVNIMTIHASKGLEFKAVFIYNAAKERKGGIKDAFVISPSFGFIPKFAASEKDTYPLIGAFEQYLRRMRELEETKRLYYVACTRATDQIFFTADSEDKTATHSLYSYLVGTFALEPFDAKKSYNHQIKTLSRPEMIHTIQDQSFTLSIVTHIENTPDQPANMDEILTSVEVCLAKISRLNSYKHLSTRMIPVSGILTYHECPYKYRLVHELRLTNFTSLLDEPISAAGSEEKSDSKNLISDGSLYGSIIHKAIELYKPELGEAEFTQLVTDQFYQLRHSPQEVKSEIFADIKKIIHSNEFSELFCTESVSEYDIRAIISNYYVTSRIDYFLLKDNRITIADYKTNKLSNLTTETLDRYGLQLDIYALLAKKLFPEVSSVESVLYITRDPSLSVRKQYSEDDFSRTEQLVSRILHNIFSGEEQIPFTVCSDCILKREGLDCEQFFNSESR